MQFFTCNLLTREFKYTIKVRCFAQDLMNYEINTKADLECWNKSRQNREQVILYWQTSIIESNWRFRETFPIWLGLSLCIPFSLYLTYGTKRSCGIYSTPQIWMCVNKEIWDTVHILVSSVASSPQHVYQCSEANRRPIEIYSLCVLVKNKIQ